MLISVTTDIPLNLTKRIYLSLETARVYSVKEVIVNIVSHCFIQQKVFCITLRQMNLVICAFVKLLTFIRTSDLNLR